MNKQFVFILVLIVGILCIATPGLLKAEEKEPAIPSAITSDDLQLGSLSIGMGYDEITKIMKVKPIKIYKNEDESFISLDYKDGTNIVITNHAVQSITVASNLYPTPRGLAVGDTRQKAFQLYGKPKEGGFEDLIWDYSMGDDPVNLEIVFEKGKVSVINVRVLEI